MSRRTATETRGTWAASAVRGDVQPKAIYSKIQSDACLFWSIYCQLLKSRRVFFNYQIEGDEQTRKSIHYSVSLQDRVCWKMFSKCMVLFNGLVLLSVHSVLIAQDLPQGSWQATHRLFPEVSIGSLRVWLAFFVDSDSQTCPTILCQVYRVSF